MFWFLRCSCVSLDSVVIFNYCCGFCYLIGVFIKIKKGLDDIIVFVIKYWGCKFCYFFIECDIFIRGL